jgi:hypothetical protein
MQALGGISWTRSAGARRAAMGIGRLRGSATLDLAVLLTARSDVPELLKLTLDLRPLCWTAGSGISAASDSRDYPRLTVAKLPAWMWVLS